MGAERHEPLPGRRAVWLVLLVALTTLPSIATRELMPTDEPRFALVARQMVEDRAPLVPHLGYDALTRQGEPYADKPPIFFWLVSLFSFATGGVNEISARLPSLLAAVAVVLLTWRIGGLLFDDVTGALGAALLATTSQFFVRAAWCSIDMTLTAFTTAAAFCWLTAARRSGPRVLFLAALGGLFAAAGVLSKGPVGVLFPVTFLAFDRLAVRLEGRDDGSPAAPRVWPRAVLLALAAFLVPVAAWIGAIAAIAGSPYVVEILFKQNVTRYVAAWNNIAPWYYYFGRLPVGLLPWVLLLPGAFLAARGARRERSVAARGLLLACGALFVFFSASTGKRGVYLLPLYPALALLLAAGWRRANEPPESRSTAAARPWARALPALHTVAFLIVGLLAPLALAIAASRRAPDLVLGAACLGAIVAVVGIAGAVLFRLGERDGALAAHIAGVAAVVCAGSFLLVPAANRKAGLRDFGAQLAALSRPGDFLVVDQEGYEQILFYARLRGARRDLDDTRITNTPETLVMEAGSDGRAGRPGGARRRAEVTEPGRLSFAGEMRRAQRRVEFPAGARVLFVAAGPRVDRLRREIGPSSRILLASTIYGKPYFVIASR